MTDKKQPEEAKPTAATAPAPAAQTPPAPEVKPTALSILLQQQEEPTTEQIVEALLGGGGLVVSSSEIRRYLQASGRKVKKVADGVLAIGANVAFLRTLHGAVKTCGLTIGIGDALEIVKNEFHVEIPPQVIKVLELAA